MLPESSAPWAREKVCTTAHGSRVTRLRASQTYSQAMARSTLASARATGPIRLGGRLSSLSRSAVAIVPALGLAAYLLTFPLCDQVAPARLPGWGPPAAPARAGQGA